MSKQLKKYKIFINYFIQNDKWESISNPNLFILPESYVNLNDVKAKSVYDNFPLQSHFTYYLRFFLDDKTQGIKGWVDFPPNATIPVYNNGNVYVKALRLPKGTNLTFKNNEVFIKKNHDYKNKENLIFLNENNDNQNNNNSNQSKENKKENFVIPDTINFGKIGETLQENKQNQPKEQQQNQNQKLNNQQNPSSNQNIKHSNTYSSNNNTFNINNQSQNQNSTINNNNSKPSNNMNNNNMNNNNMNNNNMNNNNMNNNNNFTINPNFINNNNNSQFKSPNPNQTHQQKFTNNDWGDLFSKINVNSPSENQIKSPNKFNTKIDSTLEGVFSSDIPINSNNNHNNQSQPVHDFTGANLYEIDKIPNSLDEDELKSRVSNVINKWTMGVNEKKNLLFLITTLHEVWTNSNLETPPMQKLVNDKTAVRTYYKKAMRELHADKNRDKDFKTRYIAEMLYQILNEANAAYN